MEEEGLRQGRRWLQNGKRAGGGGLKTGRRRAEMAGGGGQKAAEDVRIKGRRSPRQDAVSICATLSKLFRAINLKQLRSPRAIAGWRGALREQLCPLQPTSTDIRPRPMFPRSKTCVARIQPTIPHQSYSTKRCK